ncbi:MAG: transglutaminase, partial [Flavobacterium sp.]
ANPVLVSTRDNGIALFPSRTAFNYVIAAIETPQGNVLLDATEKYSLPNILPLRDLNWIGRLIRKDGTSTEVDLMPKEISKVVSNINIVLNSNGTADGKIKRQFVNHKALEFRKENIETAKDTYIEQLEHQNNNIEISDYVRENELDLSKPIVEGFSFKDNKDIEVINGKIYISPMLFLATKENPFKQEVREYPVDFGYPLQNKYNINIEIPDGYIVESMPAAMNIATPENMGSFKFVIANTGNKIQVIITKEINAPIVSADFYEIIKTFYQQMVDKQNEKIVLKKI